MALYNRTLMTSLKIKAFLSNVNWGYAVLLAIVLWFLIPNITPNGIKCRELGGKPDLDFTCKKITVEYLKVE